MTPSHKINYKLYCPCIPFVPIWYAIFLFTYILVSPKLGIQLSSLGLGFLNFRKTLMPTETAFELSTSCYSLNSKAHQHWIEMSILQFSGLFFTIMIPGILNLELDAIKGLLPFKGLIRWGVPIIITLIFFGHKIVEWSICMVAHRFFFRYEALRRALYLLQNKKDILNEDLRPFWYWVIAQSKNEKSDYKSEAQSVVKLNLLKYRPEEPKDDDRENLKNLYEEYKKKEARTTRILKE